MDRKRSTLLHNNFKQNRQMEKAALPISMPANHHYIQEVETSLPQCFFLLILMKHPSPPPTFLSLPQEDFRLSLSSKFFNIRLACLALCNVGSERVWPPGFGWQRSEVNYFSLHVHLNLLEAALRRVGPRFESDRAGRGAKGAAELCFHWLISFQHYVKPPNKTWES